MKPVVFTGHNALFGKDQAAYQDLPAIKFPDGEVLTCWEMSEEEFQEFSKTKKIYVMVLTFNQPLQPLNIVVNPADLITLQ